MRRSELLASGYLLKSKHSFDSKSSTLHANIKFSVFRPNLEDKAILNLQSGGQHQSTGSWL